MLMGRLKGEPLAMKGMSSTAGSSAAGAELGAAWDAWQSLQELLTVHRY